MKTTARIAALAAVALGSLTPVGSASADPLPQGSFRIKSEYLQRCAQVDQNDYLISAGCGSVDRQRWLYSPRDHTIVSEAPDLAGKCLTTPGDFDPEESLKMSPCTKDPAGQQWKRIVVTDRGRTTTALQLESSYGRPLAVRPRASGRWMVVAYTDTQTNMSFPGGYS
ncbi:RICIN domain-containing protein [Actinomadura harenae]|uniref:Ricin B lectin domain-containing protein n=1 Tax=Actinomadura harenae TaxID=2483351 RepID=A0A3M2LLP1_9ACTN|nr:RICIN domain-containing protein [Actinomadura harenae]RMI38349.1 hypothetical protein EBO15_33110 [Actinomadura harenae]